MFRYGIEHEVAFLRPDGRFADFTNTTFAEFSAIVDALPLYESDYPSLRIGDLRIKLKRWYIEGFERYDEQGNFTVCVPKGIEIRTTIQDSIAATVLELTASFQALEEVAIRHGFTAVWISYNPISVPFTPSPPLNGWESNRRQGSPEKQTADIPMMTHGPDLNISESEWTDEQAIDLAEKLTAYSPYLVPFTFSSPFAEGRLAETHSIRTERRTGRRPVALAFVDPVNLRSSVPSLTKPYRVPAERGRVELKSIDSCANFGLYGGLLAVMKGLALDTTLTERRETPDGLLHQHAAKVAFSDETIVAGADSVLTAAEQALGNDIDAEWIAPLRRMLDRRETPSQRLIDAFRQNGSVEETLAAGYALDRAR